MHIVDIRAFEALDSRGNPTLEVEVALSDGACGMALVPSGASTGIREACERRDGDPRRFHGRGVLDAARSVNTEVRDVLRDMRADRRGPGPAMIALDGTPDKSRLGANAILGVSLAARGGGQPETAAVALPGRQPACVMPVPMINVLNGGAHADNPLDFQEFMVLPVGATSFAEAVRMGAEVFHALKDALKRAGHSVNVGDEGGFAPDLRAAEEALDFLMAAIGQAGLRPGGRRAGPGSGRQRISSARRLRLCRTGPAPERRGAGRLRRR